VATLTRRTSLQEHIDESSKMQKSTENRDGLLCNLCLDNGILAFWSGEGDFFRRIHYGFPAEIRERSACPLCKLILSLIPSLDEPVEIVISPPSTWLKVTPQYPYDLWIFQDIHIRGYIRREADLIVANDETSTEYDHQIRSLDPLRVRGWISECKDLHNTPTPSVGQVIRYQHVIELTLIDISKDMLVRASSSCNYIALGYVWGDIEIFHTTSANRSSLDEPGSLRKVWSQIPPVIQDAIEFVKMLGITPYLWVDSLLSTSGVPEGREWNCLIL
jgi:hypothetical protein